MNLNYFKKLAETMIKEYLIRHSHKELNFSNREESLEYRIELFMILKKYNKKTILKKV